MINKYLVGLVFMPFLLKAQNQPVPQDITGGYTQSFSSFTNKGSSAYPAGFQGWLVGGAPPNNVGRTNEPTGNINLQQSGSAASTATGIYDYDGKIGILSSSFSDLALVLAINTSSVLPPNQIQVSFDAMVLRNLYDGITNNVLNTLVLQYRIGTSGDFTNINNVAKNGATINTSGTNGIDIKNNSFKLPLKCNNQAVVQLRWILRAVSGNLGGRPSFAIDNIVIGSIGPIAPQAFNGYTISTKDIRIVSGTTYQTNVLNDISRSANLDEYLGSSDDFVGSAKSFFTTYKNPVNGVWNLVDPSGHLFYSVGVNAVDKNGGVDPLNQLREINCNTIGNFSDETITGMPYTPRLNLGGVYVYANQRVKKLYANGIFPVFDSDFVDSATATATALITPQKVNDKNLVGYFSDNEVKLGNPYAGDKLIVAFLKVSNYGGQSIANTDPNYIAAVNWMKARHNGTLTTPNTADINEWPGYLAERYYSVCQTIIKSLDPNHLYIGSRLHQDLLNPYLFAATGKYVDVVSVNNYNVWKASDMNARFDVWANNTDKPFLVTEFYAMADDTGLPNESGAGYVVYSQQDRADFFEHYTMAVLKHKNSVGFQYFKYLDEPLSNTDPTAGANKGLLSKDYEWWLPMKNSFSKIGKDVYRLRSFLLTGNQSLPITLKQFSAIKTESNVKLSWETFSERNNNFFELQHSLDGVLFKTIASIPGQVNSDRPNLYNFYHQNPQKGVNYYKLLQHDLDGTITNDGIKVVDFTLNPQKKIQIYPNPSNGEFVINLGEKVTGQITVKLSDISGKERYVEHVNVSGINSIKVALHNHLGPGEYIISIINNQLNKCGKIIVQ